MPNNPQDNRGSKQGGQQTGKPGAGQQQDDRRPQSTTPGQGKTDQGREPATNTENDDEA